jgi:hypothetical protein
MTGSLVPAIEAELAGLQDLIGLEGPAWSDGYPGDDRPTSAPVAGAGRFSHL